ncbi:MAG: hypothetical protein HON55_05130 [Legionellales bacterium]|jgi:cytochrome c-type biogenesis protein CcmH/NrfG|nr:hypothetical protein [Legionellales bacterium]
MIVLAFIILLILFSVSYILYKTNITSITMSVSDKDYLFTPKKIKLFVILFINIVTISIYCALGNFNKIDDYYSFKKNKAQINGLIDDVKSNKKLLLLFQEKVKNHPLDNHAKYLLGKLYLAENSTQKAYEVLKIAAKVEPKNEMITESFLVAAFKLNGKLLIKNVKIANNVMEKNPKNKKVLSILTMSLYNSKKYNSALKRANQLEQLLAKHSDEHKQLMELIYKIETNLKVGN